MAKRAGEHLTLKDMIRGSGCTPRTVRYYERQGLLNAARSTGGHRLFAPEQLERLNFIISLREAGWSLEEITSLLSIRARASEDRDACRTLVAEVAEHIDRLKHKIEILTKLQADLQETRRFLAVCSECTESGRTIVCASCDRLPASAPPAGFRLTWLADGQRTAPFNDPGAPRPTSPSPISPPSTPSTLKER